eukprot:6202185-Prymnesium_polylepis.1
MVALAALLVLPLVAAASVNSVAVFGHKIPDTDAICAAVVYAWELESRGIPATAYRLGELNPETEYVLRTLDVKLPALLEEVGSGDTVAIVDTNNPAELLDGVEKVTLAPAARLSLADAAMPRVRRRRTCTASSTTTSCADSRRASRSPWTFARSAPPARSCTRAQRRRAARCPRRLRP